MTKENFRVLQLHDSTNGRFRSCYNITHQSIPGATLQELLRYINNTFEEISPAEYYIDNMQKALQSINRTCNTLELFLISDAQNNSPNSKFWNIINKAVNTDNPAQNLKDKIRNFTNTKCAEFEASLNSGAPQSETDNVNLKNYRICLQTFNSQLKASQNALNKKYKEYNHDKDTRSEYVDKAVLAQECVKQAKIKLECTQGLDPYVRDMYKNDLNKAKSSFKIYCQSVYMTDEFLPQICGELSQCTEDMSRAEKSANVSASPKSKSASSEM